MTVTRALTVPGQQTKKKGGLTVTSDSSHSQYFDGLILLTANDQRIQRKRERESSNREKNTY